MADKKQLPKNAPSPVPRPRHDEGYPLPAPNPDYGSKIKKGEETPKQPERPVGG